MDERRTFTNETGIYYLYRLGNQQRTTQQVTFVSRMSHNFVARDDYNLSFVTCNHCHNVSLNYVYSQILIGDESKMWLLDLVYTVHMTLLYFARIVVNFCR